MTETTDAPAPATPIEKLRLAPRRVSPSYLALISTFPLLPIRDVADFEVASKVFGQLETLAAREAAGAADRLDEHERGYFHVLDLLLSEYMLAAGEAAKAEVDAPGFPAADESIDAHPDAPRKRRR